MKCFSVKRAYFVVASIISIVIVIGGFSVIYTCNNDRAGDWATNLISLCLGLWFPSPGENLKEILENRRAIQSGMGGNNLLTPSESTKTETESSVTNVRAESFVKKIPNNVPYPREMTMALEKYHLPPYPEVLPSAPPTLIMPTPITSEQSSNPIVVPSPPSVSSTETVIDVDTLHKENKENKIDTQKQNIQPTVLPVKIQVEFVDD